MTRLMGDAIGANAARLYQARTDMVAGYVTGTPDIQWTAQDWALFPGIPHVTIDQGYQSALPTLATVRDVEPGAWSISQAALLGQWTAARPTIYISLAMLPALASAGWQGDVWLADWTGIPPAAPPPIPAGMRCVAVQYTNGGGGGAYDLSVVFDPDWPGIGDPPMAFMVQDASNGAIYLIDGGKSHHVNTPAAVQAYQSIGIQLVQQADAEVAALVADFPPGQPSVTVGSVTFPPFNIDLTATGTATPQ